MSLIKNGILVLPEGAKKADLRFEKGKITEVEEHLEALEGEDVYEAKDCVVFPGFIDAHTHLQMDTELCQTADDFESGTRAAVCGGTTTIVDFATQDKGGTLKQALQTWKNRARGVSYSNYAFHMAICDWNEETKKEIAEMKEKGVTSFKVYMAYENLRVQDEELLDILNTLQEEGCLCGCHCENGPVISLLQEQEFAKGNTGPGAHPVSRPAQLEAEAVNRFLYLAQLAKAPVYVVHLSSRLGLAEVRAARDRGQTVYAETCPQYLWLDDSVYDQDGFEGAKYVMSPPLRSREDVNALKEAVLHDEIQQIATDHCSFSYHTQKVIGKEDFRKIPNGAPGIEHRPALIMTLFEKELSLEKLNELLSAGPAKLMQMYPGKGALLPGSDADITVWNPNRIWTITAKNQQQNVDYTPYEGFEMKGQAAMVFINGRLAAKDGSPVGVPGGIFVERGK